MKDCTNYKPYGDIDFEEIAKFAKNSGRDTIFGHVITNRLITTIKQKNNKIHDLQAKIVKMEENIK